MVDKKEEVKKEVKAPVVEKKEGSKDPENKLKTEYEDRVEMVRVGKDSRGAWVWKRADEIKQ